MCGRFALATDGEQLAMAFDLPTVPFVAPRYNIAPTQPVAGVRLRASGARELTHFVWGLIPSWSKDMSFAGRLINARGETVAEKPSFRNAYKYRRCLIPATGFYEWQKLADGRKQPTLISAESEPILALAGLWESWHSPDGSEVESATIITTEPNATMAPIHNRMPVIVHRDDFDLWLDRDAPLPAVQSLIKPNTTIPLKTTAVSQHVNNARNEDARCIEPI